MLKIISAVLALVAGLLAVTQVTAAEPKVAWQEEFDHPNSPVDANVFYEDRGSGKNGDSVIIREMKDGVIRFGLKYDSARLQDRYDMLFGDCYWWEGQWTKWGPYDLKEYPFIEIKWRGDSLEFDYALQTVSGTRIPNYTWLPAARKETDSQGREWNISIFRVAPDSSVPTAGTPSKLLGFNIVFTSPQNGKDTWVEVDYIKVRGATDQERATDEKIVRALQDYPTGRWRGLDTFFPFGTYFFHKRGDFESWNGDEDFEGAYGTLARHRFNYVVDDDEIELGRLQGTMSDEGFRDFVDNWKRAIASAKATGMKLGVGVSRLTQGRDVANGYEQFLPIARKVVAAFPTDDVVISWYIWDEPSQGNLLPIVMATRAMREADALKRPELTVFNNAFAAQSYSAYLSLSFWDNYPVLEGSRDPWAIRDQAKAHRKAMPGKPMWVVLPAFETLPPIPNGSYARPSDAEMRLMAYLAVAEGAKGLVWFVDWMNGGNLQGFTDRVGQPRGGMIYTLEGLSKRLVPTGKLLLATDPVDGFRPNVKQVEPITGEKGRGISVSLLKHKKLPISYLVVVNEDLDSVRTASVALPRGVLRKGDGVYDLYSLNGVNSLIGGRFSVKPLAGGDGRVYLIGDLKELKRQRTLIQCDTASEDLRSLMPDISIATRWELPLTSVDKAVADCWAKIKAGDGTGALAAASQAKYMLERAMESHSEFAATRRAIEDMRIELAEIGPIAERLEDDPLWFTGRHHPMMVPNSGFLELSKRYWVVGQAFKDISAKFIKGEKEGLWPAVSKTRIECLKVREDLLAKRREKLEPAKQQ